MCLLRLSNKGGNQHLQQIKKGAVALFFLCFTTYFAFFFSKNLHMSDKSSTFALEIGKGSIYGLAPVKQNEQRRGATREE